MTTTETKTEKTRAEQNAEGHAESMLEMYRAHKALEDGAEVATVEGDEYTDSDAVRERAQDSALEVSVRSGWYSPGDSERDDKPAEFKILLTTGGPALRIFGELDNCGQPENARLQVQDWGTPWTDYRADAEDAADWDDAFGWFLGCFWFGE